MITCRFVLPLAVVLLTVGCSATAVRTRPSAATMLPSASVERPSGFPATCAPSEIQVMLLGTMHFRGSPTDDFSTSLPNVLSAENQAALDTLVTRLERWAPEQVAIELVARDSIATREEYQRYVADGGRTENQQEYVQIGFRLARRLRHAEVFPIDYQMPIGNDSLGPLIARRPDLQSRAESLTISLGAEANATERVESTRPLISRLRRINSDSAIHAGNSGAMFFYLGAGDGGNRAGPQLLARWYERNFEIAHNLTRVLRPRTRRVLLVFGSGHVPPLRTIFDESPEFCPVSPLSFLQ